MGFFLAAHRFSSCGASCSLSSYVAWASFLCNIWGFSSLIRDWSCIPSLQGKFLSTGPPGRSQEASSDWYGNCGLWDYGAHISSLLEVTWFPHTESCWAEHSLHHLSPGTLSLLGFAKAVCQWGSKEPQMHVFPYLLIRLDLWNTSSKMKLVRTSRQQQEQSTQLCVGPFRTQLYVYISVIQMHMFIKTQQT